MEAERWNHITLLFEESSRIPTDERRTFLEERCHGDTGLVREVLDLLKQDEHAHLQPPGRTELQRATTRGTAEDLSGSRLGPYRLERILGRGGMGAVYLAFREDADFEQEVAIKLIRRGLDTDDILARFHNERQVLAKLTHPGIARLLDGGATEDGRPYLVMEVVDGQAIDLYCEARGLEIDERLRLFLRVCEAIQHAHERRIVHRDLKPSNILVTLDGHPKLLDFGIAKLLDATGSVKTVDVTVTELRLMTPEYASPEQVQSGKVDARSDVYALGVILYELLTGQRPYAVTTGLRTDLERAICEEDPARPSRRVESRRLRTQLSGDLDTIVLTALRKEPGRRYCLRARAGERPRALPRGPAGSGAAGHLALPLGQVRAAQQAAGGLDAGHHPRASGGRGRHLSSMFLEAESERREALAREYVARHRRRRRAPCAISTACQRPAPPGSRATGAPRLGVAPSARPGGYQRTDASGPRSGAVRAAAWSPDGKLLATGGQDRRVILWER